MNQSYGITDIIEVPKSVPNNFLAPLLSQINIVTILLFSIVIVGGIIFGHKKVMDKKLNPLQHLALKTFLAGLLSILTSYYLLGLAVLMGVSLVESSILPIFLIFVAPVIMLIIWFFVISKFITTPKRAVVMFILILICVGALKIIPLDSCRWYFPLAMYRHILYAIFNPYCDLSPITTPKFPVVIY